MPEQQHPDMEDDAENYELTADELINGDGNIVRSVQQRLRMELEHGSHLNASSKQAANMLELYINLDIVNSENVYVRSTRNGIMVKVWCRDGSLRTLIDLNNQIIRGLTRKAHIERFHYDTTAKYDLLEIEE